MKEKGKKIENKTNKHIRNKYTYSNKTITITTTNINNNSFQKTYLLYRMITTTAVVKTTTIPKHRPKTIGVLCLFSSLAWADSYSVGKKNHCISFIFNRVCKTWSEIFSKFFYGKNKFQWNLHHYKLWVWRGFIFSLNAHVSGKCRVIV